MNPGAGIVNPVDAEVVGDEVFIADINQNVVWGIPVDWSRPTKR